MPPHSPQTPPKKTAEQRTQASLALVALYQLPIYQLPTEVILNIVQRLELADFPSLMAAAWHLLRLHGIADSIATPRLHHLLVAPRRGFYRSLSEVSDGAEGGELDFLPQHVRRHMLHRLAPGDRFFRFFTDMCTRLRGGFERLPLELRIAISRHMDPKVCTNVVLACFRFSDRDIEWMTHQRV